MSEGKMPERVWVYDRWINDDWIARVADETKPRNDATEYVRADLLAEAIVLLIQWRADSALCCEHGGCGPVADTGPGCLGFLVSRKSRFFAHDFALAGSFQ